MKHIIETVIEIYEIVLICWVDPQYPWSQGIGSPIWGSSMTRVKIMTYREEILENQKELYVFADSGVNVASWVLIDVLPLTLLLLVANWANTK